MTDAHLPSGGDVAPLRMVVLHVLPGAVQMTASAVLARPMLAAGAPRTLPFLAAVVMAGLPCMLAVLLRARGRAASGGPTGCQVVGNREPMPVWQYVALYVALFALAFGLLLATAPLNRLLAERVFFWLPDYLQSQWQPPAPPARALVLLGLVLQVVIDGVLAPVTEEVYFRGYLLPRMGYLGGWAPAVNALLFAVQHFWQPYNWVLIFLHSVSLTYLVWWKRNIYIGMLLHGSANTGAAIVALVGFFAS
jgi:membrane protease YdiL (CAAX protease family)